MSKDLWNEFVIDAVITSHGQFIPLCGLCGNSGIVDTSGSETAEGTSFGIRNYCICPNGRTMKLTKMPL